MEGGGGGVMRTGRDGGGKRERRREKERKTGAKKGIKLGDGSSCRQEMVPAGSQQFRVQDPAPV